MDPQADSKDAKTPAAPASSQPSYNVVLTPLESQIFDKIEEACKQLKLKTTVRAAGGWVRDKLLGRESHDLDLALDDMLGKDFAELMNKYLESKGETVHSIGVIRVNPEQSKHLETATFKINGVLVDVNNLRTEIYEGTSRIPTMKMGTAEEDAHRRDFTLNALFYNIHTRKIEDFCKTGLQDLKDGLLRTPLPALTTFRDDPLRVLRAARFASRFGFRLDQALLDAARDKNVRTDLLEKVSRERYGIEVGKMLAEQGKAAAGFDIICSFGLRSAVFHLPNSYGPEPDVPATERAVLPDEAKGDLASLSELLSGRVRAMQRLFDEEVVSHPKEDQRVYMLSAILSNLYGYRFEEKKGKFIPLAAYIVRDALKLPNKLAVSTAAAISAAHSLIKTMRASANRSADDQKSRDAIQLETGLLLRSTGPDWRPAVCLAQVLLAGTSEAKAMADFKQWIEISSGLVGCWSARPLVDGNVLMKQFGLKGRAVGIVTQKSIEWQLLNPTGSLPACKAYLESWIKDHEAELNAPPPKK